VYVTDPEGYRVLIFSDEGQYLGRFGHFGQDINSLGLPNGIAVDADGNIYIADAGNNRVLRFAPLFTRVDEEEPVDEQPVEGENGEENGEEVEASPSPTGEEEASPSPIATEEEEASPSPSPTATEEEEPSPTPTE
jgi:DNA-binding beta-propeller fold protein YncE